MTDQAATARAHPNIAFIKYWGNRDEVLRLPANSSLSMNLGELHTTTTVQFDPSLAKDELSLKGKAAEPGQTARVSQFLDLVRQMAGSNTFARVESENNFPSGAGIASSSSAFAALALAASAAVGLTLDEQALSQLARRGSGSASRSVPGGFVEWRAADRDEDSYAFSIAPAEHWALTDCIAIVSEQHKSTGSTQGHSLAATSPLQAARVQGAEQRLELCRAAIMNKDFAAFAQVVELDCHLMHAVMMTSQPGLHYWLPASVAVMQAVRDWRSAGIPVCYTLDAGPNIHVLCPVEVADRVTRQLQEIDGVLRVLGSGPGGPARLVTQANRIE
ncbi:MAG: diphosphomevalonate decarboxylase [Chloroflexi bacterium]|nr:diphosphomevalonate decarboxylase [Chloroflexota bacterium]